MPIGNGVVLTGIGERTTPQAVFQVADQLFKQKAARVISCRAGCVRGPGQNHRRRSRHHNIARRARYHLSRLTQRLVNLIH